MPVLRFFSSVAQPTTLSGSIGSGATSITVGATTGFPATTPYTLALDFGAATEELVDVTGVAGTNLTVTRGVDGTSAQSHSLGAVVRHVASGRDFADYQTHQAATTAIHGVAGTLVGTSDSQTLANKTLTNPIINAAAFTGTLTGTPTWSGAVVFSGAPSFTGSPVFSGDPDFRGALTTDPALRVRVTGDTNPRLNVGADGKFTWGSGGGAGDVILYRSAADLLATDSTFRVNRPTAADDVFQTRVTGDTASRLRVAASGAMSWGPGGAAGVDANFYRTSASVMKTDTALSVGTDLSVGGNLSVTGIGQIMVAYKAAAETVTSSTTLQDDDELTFACAANAKYLLTGHIKYSQNLATGATAGIKAGFALPASGTLEWTSHGTALLTDATTFETIVTTSTGTRSMAANGATTMAFAPIGSLVTTSSGTLVLRWAQVSSSGTGLTVQAGSWLMLRRIA